MCYIKLHYYVLLSTAVAVLWSVKYFMAFAGPMHSRGMLESIADLTGHGSSQVQTGSQLNLMGHLWITLMSLLIIF